MFTDRSSLKWKNIQRNPYASLCVDWREPPYRSVILDGLVEEVDRSLYELVLMMALRYYGDEVGTEFAQEYKDQSANVAAFRLVPERIANYLET
jgi:pyridoxine/pyridoxamine 5'-phosphate oxidase